MRKPYTLNKLAGFALWLLAFLQAGWLQAQVGDDRKRYVIYPTYLGGDASGDDGIRDVTYALDHGCNAIEIGIRWQNLMQTATGEPNWNRYDRIVALALSRNAKVAFRLATIRITREGFWPEEQVMRDTRGNLMNIGGEHHFRFGYTPAANKAVEFIRSVTQRYQYLNSQGKLLFFSVVTSPYLELEYFGSNYRGDGSPSYVTLYDYNELTIADFQRWVVRKYNNSLTELNQKWGSDYRNVTDIRPPYPNAEGYGAFGGTRGLDWYLFRHSQMKAFADQCNQAIKSVDNSIRIVNQHGSVHDPNSASRATYAFKNLAETADGIKVNDNPWWPFQYSMDVVRSNVKSGGWVMNEIDGMFSLSHPGVNSYLKAQIEESFKYGANAITLANYIVGLNEGYLKELLDFTKARGFLDVPVSVVTPVNTVTYKLSGAVQNGLHEMGVTGQWQTAKGSDGKPVRLLLDEDILGGPTGNVPPTIENGIPDQQGLVGQAFSYRIPDNTFRDSDGQISSISVSGLPAGLSYEASNRTISGTPSAVGSTEVTVTATDNQNAVVSDYFTLAVRQTASPLRLLDPILTCNTGRFEFRSADGDGTSVEYKLDGITNWAAGTSITLEDRYRYGSALTVKARQNGREVTLNYTTTCSTTNRPPVVANPLADRVFAQGQYVDFTLPANTFSDPDGQIASISVSGLPPGMSFAVSGRNISGAISAGGSWNVTVTATDNQGATVSDVFVVSTSGQVKPLRLLTPTLNCNTGRFEFNTTDGDGTAIEYSMDRVFDWTSQSVHTLSETVRQNDMHFRARQSGVTYFGSYLPNCPPPNRLPVVANSIASQNLTQYRNVSFTIPANTFSDPDGRITAIALSALPAGLTYDAKTQTLSGAATVAGSWTVTATATDDREGTVSTTFVIAVARDIRPLRLLAPVLTCNTGRLEFKTADGDGTTIQYSIDGILNWTTQDAFTLPLQQRFDTPLTIRARQGSNDISLTYRTTCPRTNLPPVVATPIPNQVLTVNQPASVAIPAATFTDPDGQITSVTLTNLPVGLTYDPTRRAITGTPTLIGSSAVVARAVDNAGASVSDTFQITVRSAPRFTVTANLLDAQGKTLRTISEGDLIDIQKVPTLVNINCVPKTTAGSVQMELSGKSRRNTYTNTGPYQLFPIGQGFKPVVGAYQLKVSVFSGPNGTGTVLGTTTMRFDIVTTNEPGSVNVLSEK